MKFKLLSILVLVHLVSLIHRRLLLMHILRLLRVSVHLLSILAWYVRHLRWALVVLHHLLLVGILLVHWGLLAAGAPLVLHPCGYQVACRLLLQDLGWLRPIVSNGNVWNLNITAVALVLADTMVATSESTSGSRCAVAVIVQDHFRFDWMVYSMCIIARSTLGPSRCAWRSVHTRGCVVHYQVRPINISGIRHRVLLLGLVNIVLATIVAHNAIVGDSALWLILSWLALGVLAWIDNASTHALVERPSHVQAILLVVYHTLSVSLAWGSQLVLVIPAVAAGSLIQNASVLSLVASNLSHEIVILRDHVASSIAGLLAVWLIPLARGGHSPVLHAQSAMIVWALTSLIHALHVFSYDVILARLRGVLVHMA